MTLVTTTPSNVTNHTFLYTGNQDPKNHPPTKKKKKMESNKTTHGNSTATGQGYAFFVVKAYDRAKRKSEKIFDLFPYGRRRRP